MKKKRFIILFCIILILVGGSYLKKEFDKKEIIETEGPRIEKYLKYNYKGIDSITFTTVKMNPTGVPHIIGYVNNNKDMNFNAGIYKNHFSRSLDFFDKIPEYKNKDGLVKSVSEIEKEEANHQN